MGLFKRKAIKSLRGSATWGHLAYAHRVDMNTMTRDLRRVERDGVLDNGIPVKFVRVFSLRKTEEKGVTVTGWETLDQHPDLIMFEGYETKRNVAHLERKRKSGRLPNQLIRERGRQQSMN